MEKFLRTKIKHKPNYKYEVFYGGCVMMIGQDPENDKNIIYWFNFQHGKEMRETWKSYEYFIDDEGDISRTLRKPNEN